MAHRRPAVLVVPLPPVVSRRSFVLFVTLDGRDETRTMGGRGTKTTAVTIVCIIIYLSL